MCFLNSDVYLSLNDVFIPNHGYVIISDIGTAGDDTALLCHTNHPADMTNIQGNMHSGGDWFRPNRGNSFPRSQEFRRNRGSMVVRLFRGTASTDPPVEGIYYCEVEDDTNTLQRVFIGLYANDSRGNTQCM